MRHNKNIFGKLFFLFLIIIATNTLRAEKSNSMLRFEYFKLNDGTKQLRAKLNSRIGGRLVTIAGAPISFLVQSDTSEILIGSFVTDEKGVATVFISKDYKFFFNDEKYITFFARFNGNDSLNEILKDLAIKEAYLTMFLEEVDSVKTAKIILLTDTIPIEAATINIYVKRMVGMLLVGSGETDTDGTISIEFPSDIPGDSLGNLVVIAKLEESDDYGNIECAVTKPWGTTLYHHTLKHQRSLWSAEAPLWMIWVTCILLIGIWVNFFLAISKVAKIAKSKDLENK